MHARMQAELKELISRCRRARDKAEAIALMDAWAKANIKDQRYRVSEEMRRKMKEMYDKNYKLAEIEVATGATQQTIRRILGIVGDKRRGRIEPETVAQIRHYTAMKHWTVDSIAAEVGVSSSTVRRVLMKEGLWT